MFSDIHTFLSIGILPGMVEDRKFGKWLIGGLEGPKFSNLRKKCPGLQSGSFLHSFWRRPTVPAVFEIPVFPISLRILPWRVFEESPPTSNARPCGAWWAVSFVETRLIASMDTPTKYLAGDDIRLMP
ncbi:MAG TPA: hypothetical protein PLD82_01125 [Spirochaetota bacterium]|nr:hypothetical protein [Spirochaetota bacterium]